MRHRRTDRPLTPYATFTVILVTALLLAGEVLAALLAFGVLVWFRWASTRS